MKGKNIKTNSMKTGCDLRVFQTRNKTAAIMGIIMVTIALIFPILIWTDVIPFSIIIDNTQTCNTCVNGTNNVTQNVYECRSNVTLFLPVWYEVAASDESETWTYIDDKDSAPSYGVVTIDSIYLRIISLNYAFADTYYGFTDEGEADAYLVECENNRVQIEYEEIDIYLRNPRYFDVGGDISLNDRTNETFQLPIGKASFLSIFVITYRAWAFSGKDAMNTGTARSNKASILNVWQCGNINITLNELKFNSAGQYLSWAKTTITSSNLPTETVTWYKVP